MFPWSKSFEIFARIKYDNDVKVLRIFKGLFQKSLKARSPHGSSNNYDKIKKHGIAVLFVCIECWGVAPNPDQRTFCEKSFGNPKAFAQ